MHRGIIARGFDSTYAVGWKRFIDEKSILEINPDKTLGLWGKTFLSLAKATSSLPGKTGHYSGKLLQGLARPASFIRWWQGKEEFHYPAFSELVRRPLSHANLVHLHNLHGGYFDLRVLSDWSQLKPLLLTLHDEWLYTGHCACSLDCEKWKTGCGHCPYLDVYPSIRKDNTRNNLLTKNNIYKNCKFYVATPSKWLLDRVKQSVISPSIVKSRVIHNGINTDIFKPADKLQARSVIGIDSSACLLLFVSNYIKANRFKNFDMIKESVYRYAKLSGSTKVICLAIGETAKTEITENLEIRYVPYVKERNELARYYQAADLYLHASHSEIWGLTVTEAQACGLPVVATATGGIPEQVNSLQHHAFQYRSSHDSSTATGMLVQNSDIEGMCQAMHLLNSDLALRESLSANAARRAEDCFNINTMIDKYIDWYQEINTENQQPATTG